MAFGGVATGSMKAKLALIVAGNMSNSGSSKLREIEALPKMGKRTLADAVLLVISVKKVTIKQRKPMINHNGKSANKTSCSPKMLVNPEATKPSAITIPPANNNKIPQGIRSAEAQSNNP